MRVLRFIIPALLPLAALAGEYLPLETGNLWTYRNAATGQTFSVRVGLPLYADGQIYYSLSGFVSRSVWARMDRLNNQVVYLDEEIGRERPLVTFMPVEGAWWEAPLRPCDQLGQSSSTPARHTGPAGDFENALDVRYRVYSCADVGVVSEKYAENIGMLSRVENSISGPRQFDLVYARVGRAVIEGSRFARFTVTADTSPVAASANITMRLETNPDRTLTLNFPTGQEYDVQILDAQGSPLWSWAASAVFIQATHSLDVNGSWSVTVQAPAATLARGARLVAFTTSTPRFEASVPLAAPAATSARERILRPAPVGRQR